MKIVIEIEERGSGAMSMTWHRESAEGTVITSKENFVAQEMEASIMLCGRMLTKNSPLVTIIENGPPESKEAVQNAHDLAQANWKRKQLNP